MNEQTATEWRDCADPDELAAAVAAGVEVLAMGRAGDFPTANQTADQFAGSLRAGITYQLPPPAPPWPGAVLSGLTDEDGEPTWLALAPNVLGEAVRTCVDFPWFICGSDNAVTPYWVEVRAPRAVPEPETERVDALKVLRDRSYRIELTHPEGEFLAVGVELREDGDLVAIEQQEPWGKAQPVAPDGTVEVLKDGDR